MGTLLREKLEAKLDMRKQGIQMEKMLSQQDFVPGLIHKLNNHLAPVIGYGQLLLPKTIDPEAKQYLEKMIEGVQQASQVIKGFVNFASRKSPRRKSSILMI